VVSEEHQQYFKRSPGTFAVDFKEEFDRDPNKKNGRNYF